MKNSESNEKQVKKEPIKSGRAPVVASIHKDLGFGPLPSSYDASRDIFTLDPELKKELADKQLAYRFINYKAYKAKGFHQAHWKPYKRDSQPKNGALFTVGPDGYTTHQDIILAVKPLEWNEEHKRYLKQKANRQANPEKLKAEELRQSMSSSGLDLTVSEGYEEDK